MALALHWLLRCGGKSPLGNMSLACSAPEHDLPLWAQLQLKKISAVRSCLLDTSNWRVTHLSHVYKPSFLTATGDNADRLPYLWSSPQSPHGLPRAHTGCHTHTSSFTLSPNHTPVFCFLVSFLFAFTSKPSDLKHHAQQRSCLINSIAVFALWQIHPWQEKKLDFYVHKR